MYTNLKYFLKIMIEGQKVMERTKSLSVEDQPTKIVLTQTCAGVFFIRSASDTIFAMRSFRNHLRTSADHSLINTAPE
jgi:hypothetical protein